MYLDTHENNNPYKINDLQKSFEGDDVGLQSNDCTKEQECYRQEIITLKDLSGKT
jgi:hypothetical protein